MSEKRGILGVSKLGYGFRQRKGQVTIFIIIAIVIVGLATLFYLLVPGLRTGSGADVENPEAFIQTCLEDDLNGLVETISAQGGSLNPEHYFTYNNINIQYLCYTNEDFSPCVIQEPLLKQSIEIQLEEELDKNQGLVENCFNQLQASFQDQGYTVKVETGTTNVEILPERITTNIDYIVTLTRDETQEFDGFTVVLNNNLYELLSFANNIVEHEIAGDEPTEFILAYVGLYPYLTSNIKQRDDGTRIYTLEDDRDRSKFEFAVRSYVKTAGF